MGPREIERVLNAADGQPGYDARGAAAGVGESLGIGAGVAVRLGFPPDQSPGARALHPAIASRQVNVSAAAAREGIYRSLVSRQEERSG